MSLLGTLLTTISALSLLGVLLFLVYLSTTLRKAPVFPDSLKTLPKLVDRPKVSVIVTARNEEQTIRRCINSLTTQTYPDFEILVVDDSSTDRTVQIVGEFQSTRVRLLEAGSKPEGWSGKSWPCWRGFENSTGDVLLFVDADSWFDPKCIELAVGYMLSSGIDMFSLSPRVEMKGIWAPSILPIITGAINLLYPMVKVNDKKNDRAYVFGTFILVKRKVYASIGGHKQVRGDLVEDVAIARLVKSAGYNLRIERGSEYLATEWEHTPSSIYSGLERITSTSIKSYGFLSILNAILLFFIGIYPIAYIIGFVVAYLAGSGLHTIMVIGLITSILNVISFLMLARLQLKAITYDVGLFPILYPLGVLIFMLAIITTSIKVSTGKGISWKGTTFN